MTPQEFEPKVSAAIRLLQSEIHDSGFYPREGYGESAVAMVTPKALRLSLAVCHLVAGGFYGEAFGLTRSVLEAFFVVKWISSDPSGDRARSYLEFWKAAVYNHEQIREKYFPGLDPPDQKTQEVLDAVKRQIPQTKRWEAAFNMASEYYDHPADIDPKTGKGFQALSDYEQVYEHTSHYVHVLSMSTRENYDSPPFRCHDRD